MPVTLLKAALALVVVTGVWLAAPLLPARAEQPVDWDGTDLRALTGGQLDTALLSGRVVLLVNTASKCAFTPQYEGLEALSDRYQGVGLTVLGVPSNDFGGQEPGSNDEIAAFCSATYGVSFPMLAKSPVTGPQAHPLFAWAKSAGGRMAIPAWNFHKILIGRDGRFVAAFPSFVKPEDNRVVAAVEKALRTPAF
ncbi:MAG: glutathione peroxidase [Pseudomonadota bacterium]